MRSSNVVNRLIFLACLIVSCGAQSSCAHAPTDKQNYLRIELQSLEPDTAFYVMTGHYAMLFERSTLIAQLHDQASASGSRIDEKLLAEVKRTPDNLTRIALSSYVLATPDYLQRLDLLAANLLARGVATVVDLHFMPGEGGRIVSTIQQQTITRGVFSARRFLTSDGQQLVQIVDSVE